MLKNVKNIQILCSWWTIGFCVLCIWNLHPVQGQELDQKDLDKITQKYVVSSYGTLRDILSIPNNARMPSHIQANAAWLKVAFEKRNFTTSLLPTDGAPLVFAERRVPSATQTILIYLQIDGQPVDPDKWQQADPYKPVLMEKQGDRWAEIGWDRLNDDYDEEWRVFARSASDAKGPVAMFLTALDALDNEKLKQTFNIKIVMDLEEELGSPHILDAVKRHKEVLASDMLLVFDGPRHASNEPTLYFGARGIAYLGLTVFGPVVPQHSGSYGNYVPNPALRLSQLLASMKEPNGKVTIGGFYDGVKLDDATLRILESVPDDEVAIKATLGIAKPDEVGQTYQEAMQYPSLSILGMESGWVGDQVRTIIPSKAVAALDLRLVPESDPDTLIKTIREHIEAQGYHLISGEQPTAEERKTYDRLASFSARVAYGAFRTPLQSKEGVWLSGALTRAFGKPPIVIRMGGGSIPISPFIAELGTPAIIVPTVFLENNQHSPNENLRLGNYSEGVKTFLAILTHDGGRL